MPEEEFILDESTLLKEINPNVIVLKSITGRYLLKGELISKAIKRITNEFKVKKTIEIASSNLESDYSKPSITSLINYLIEIKVLLTESDFEILKEIEEGPYQKFKYHIIEGGIIKEVEELHSNKKLGIIASAEFINAFINEIILENVFMKFNVTVIDNSDANYELKLSHNNQDAITYNENFKDTLNDSDITLVFSDYENYNLFEEINRLSLVLGKRWLRIMVDGDYIEIGPIFTPKGKPCYKCLTYQAKKNFIDNDAIFDSIYELPIKNIGLAYDFSLRKFIFSIIFRELIQHFLMNKSILHDNVLTINWNSYNVSSERIFNNPNCETCQ